MADLTSGHIPVATGATQIDDSSLVASGGTLGTENGVNLTLKAPDGVASGDYSLGKNAYLRSGGGGSGGVGSYGGNINLYAGAPGSGAYNYGGGVNIIGTAGSTGKGGKVDISGGAAARLAVGVQNINITPAGIIIGVYNGANLKITGLSTTSTGAGYVWNDSGTLKIG